MRSILPLCLAVLASACGGGNDPAPPTGFQRLTLELLEGSPAAAKPRSLARVPAPTAIGAWSVEAPRAEIEADEGGAPVLMVGGKGLKRMTVPGPLPDADQLVVLMRNAGNGALRASFLRNGEVAVVAQGEVIKGRKLHPVSIDLPPGRERGGSYDAVRLEFDVRAQSRIHSIDMVERPLASLLPSIEEGPELVTAGTEARRAVALQVGRPLTISFDPRGAGRLAIGAATPAFLARSSAVQKVEARVQGARAQIGGQVIEFGQGLTMNLDPSGEKWGGGSMSEWPSPTERVVVEFRLISDAPDDVCLLAEPVLYSRVDDPATVLVVTSDTHRADHLGLTAAGVELDTPNLDAFAARGVLFENAWATSNTTIPSHGALLSGLHPRDTKLLGNFSSLAQEATTLAEVFSARGYRTVAVVSSTHLADEFSGLGQGFDVMLQPEASEARAEDSVRRLLGEIGRSEGTPVFAWLHLFDAHAPYDPPADYDRRYYPEGSDPFDASLPALDLEGGRLPMWLTGLRDHAFPRAQYRAEIASLDAALGRLFAHERIAGGIAAVTSDHGEVFARRGVFYEHKGLLPDTLHVPLMLAWPGAKAGERVAGPVRQMDVGRTLLDLAGLADAAFPGRNLVNGDPVLDEPRFAVTRRFASVTQGRWHCAITLTDLSAAKDGAWPRRHQVELFDIEADPGCVVDVAAAEPDRARRMRASILAWLENADPVLRASKPNLDRAARSNLAALGYAEDDEAVGPSLFERDCDCVECARYR